MPMTSRCLVSALLASAALPAFAGQPRVTAAYDAQLHTLAGSNRDTSELHLRIRVPGSGESDIRLEINHPLQSSAERFVDGVTTGEVAFFRGTIQGNEGSWARLTRIHQEWFGLLHDGDTLWLIDPASQHPQLTSQWGAASSGSVIFSLDDVSGLVDFHHDERFPPISPDSTTPSKPNVLDIAQTKYLRVSLVLDREFQQFWGGSASAIAAGILNAVDGLYSQAQTEVSLHALQPLATNGTLVSTNVELLLGAFSTYSASGAVPFHGLAHLLSGKDFDGNTVGFAYIGNPAPGYVPTVCDSRYGTGINQITMSSALGALILAHEMGHNYGSLHDGPPGACPGSGFIMAPSVNPSSSSFSQCSLDAFTAYQTARQPGCLLDINLVFANGFE